MAAALREREAWIRRWQAEQGAILAELQSRGVFAETGYGSLEALQSDILQISRREGRVRAKRALACHPTIGVGGREVVPVAPLAAEAAAAGEIGTEQLDDIVAILHRIPAEVPEEERAAHEHSLVSLARVVEPWRVRKAGRHLLARVNPDGLAPPEDTPERPYRQLRWHWQRNGRLRLTGELDGEAAQELLTALSPLTKPRPADDGERDPRGVGERNADGLIDLVRVAMRVGELPIEGGERPTVIVTLGLNDLRGRAGDRPEAPARAAPGAEPPATLNHLPIDAEAARRWACDCGVIPAVLGSSGEVLDLGQKKRVVSAPLRRALILRDQGCIKCGKPARWCDAHHRTHWIDGGETSLANCCLLCGECHRLVHHAGWTITLNGNGVPEMHPPPWIPTPPHRRRPGS